MGHGFAAPPRVGGPMLPDSPRETLEAGWQSIQTEIEVLLLIG